MRATTHGSLIYCVSTNPSITTCPAACPATYQSTHIPLQSPISLCMYPTCLLPCPQPPIRSPLIHHLTCLLTRAASTRPQAIPSVHHPLTRMPPRMSLLISPSMHSFLHASIPVFLHSFSLNRSGRGSHKSAYKALCGALPGSSKLPPSPFSPAERVIPAHFPFVCQPLLSSRLAGDHNVLPHLPLPLVGSETGPV